MSSAQRTSTPGVHREIWHAATAYIQARLATPLSLDDVARAAITSRRQLQRVFALVGGTTVRAYTHQARMRRAHELIVTSRLSVSAIATEVGYTHASAFIKAFRLHHGTTPSALRRSQAM